MLKPIAVVVCSLSLITVGLVVPVRADLIISVESANVASGGTGTVDVFVTSTNNDSLGVTSLQFDISRISGASTLQFTNPQSNSFLGQSNYVFTGNSFDSINSVSFFGSPTTTVTPNDTLLGGDNTNDFTNVTLTSGQPYLLAALTVQSQTGAAVGDQFQISLDPSSSFLLSDFSPTAPYTSDPGTITISPPSVATPEPGTLTLLISGGGVLLLCRRRFRFKS